MKIDLKTPILGIDDKPMRKEDPVLGILEDGRKVEILQGSKITLEDGKEVTAGSLGKSEDLTISDVLINSMISVLPSDKDSSAEDQLWRSDIARTAFRKKKEKMNIEAKDIGKILERVNKVYKNPLVYSSATDILDPDSKENKK